MEEVERSPEGEDLMLVSIHVSDAPRYGSKRIGGHPTWEEVGEEDQEA